MNLIERVPLPAPNAMNGGLTYPTVLFMTNLLGRPRLKMTQDCASVTNVKLKAKMSYGFEVAGHIDVSGLTLACQSLRRIFNKVRDDDLMLYRSITSAGMLCVRNIRGVPAGSYRPSNHSWGAAIDLKIGGVLDQRGDGHCLRGLLMLYPYFHNEGWFWGAEYKGKWEDSMHMECSTELLRKWYG